MGQCTSAPDSSASGKNSDIEVKVSEAEVSSSKFESTYKLKDVLGTGAFSTVRKGLHKQTGNAFAVKCIKRQGLSEDDRLALLDEVDILKAMQQKSIIKLYDFYDEPAMYYLVMENMTGGELFDRIVAKQFYNEADARGLVRTLLVALDYMHQNAVAHRDLKPENLLLSSMDDDTDVKLADFGFAKRCNGSKCLKTQCGTPGYVAPEILEGKLYDFSADMWSIGVILYIILGGYPPFYEENQSNLFKKIKAGEYEFHKEYWENVSIDAKDLIKSMLTVNPNKRATAAECLNSSWIGRETRLLSAVDLGKNLEEFRKFNARRKFKSGVHAIMTVNKLKLMGMASAAKKKESAAELPAVAA